MILNYLNGYLLQYICVYFSMFQLFSSSMYKLFFFDAHIISVNQLISRSRKPLHTISSFDFIDFSVQKECITKVRY